ncbi:hypothetical protein AVEN_103888-1 [Araneus ventricosus]|uniref:Uncharacterized protein n=1 Tax=Araneus ventricosus TaxID=182803 RepID=A0A4Y2K6U3_ARAVE|nr:hypothetical protein AVEN_103888-1 [Araneus ventricosus]
MNVGPYQIWAKSTLTDYHDLAIAYSVQPTLQRRGYQNFGSFTKPLVRFCKEANRASHFTGAYKAILHASYHMRAVILLFSPHEELYCLSLIKTMEWSLPKLSKYFSKRCYPTWIKKFKPIVNSRTNDYQPGNPIVCNCDVKWITNSGKLSIKRIIGTCAEPESFKGRLLESLTDEDFRYCR